MLFTLNYPQQNKKQNHKIRYGSYLLKAYHKMVKDTNKAFKSILDSLYSKDYGYIFVTESTDTPASVVSNSIV